MQVVVHFFEIFLIVIAIPPFPGKNSGSCRLISLYYIIRLVIVKRTPAEVPAEGSVQDFRPVSAAAPALFEMRAVAFQRIESYRRNLLP